MKKWLLRVALVVLVGLVLIVGVVLLRQLAARSEIEQAQQTVSTAVPRSIGVGTSIVLPLPQVQARQ